MAGLRPVSPNLVTMRQSSPDYYTIVPTPSQPQPNPLYTILTPPPAPTALPAPTPLPALTLAPAPTPLPALTLAPAPTPLPILTPPPTPTPVFTLAPAPTPVPLCNLAPVHIPAPVPVPVAPPAVDQLYWPPPGGNDCGCIFPIYDKPIPLTRRTSEPDLSNLAVVPVRAQNIDNYPLQAVTMAAPGASPYGTGFIVNTTNPLPQAQHINGYSPNISVMPQAQNINGYSPDISAMPPKVMGRPNRSVNMNRAMGFALVATCLCPPMGLVGLGTAMRGRHHRYKNIEHAMYLRKISYIFSTLVVIIIVLGIICIVVLSQRYRYF